MCPDTQAASWSLQTLINLFSLRRLVLQNMSLNLLSVSDTEKVIVNLTALGGTFGVSKAYFWMCPDWPSRHDPKSPVGPELFLCSAFSLRSASPCHELSNLVLVLPSVMMFLPWDQLSMTKPVEMVSQVNASSFKWYVLNFSGSGKGD